MSDTISKVPKGVVVPFSGLDSTGKVTSVYVTKTSTVNGADYGAAHVIVDSGAITSLVLAAGSAIIGKVGIDQTTPGTTNLVALAANQSVNVAQIAGVTTAMGSGAVSTGTQRVILATDQPVIPVSDNGGSLTVDGTVDITQSALSSSTGAWTRINSGGSYVGSLVIKNGAGRCRMIIGYNSKASAQWVQIHNTTSLPSDTAVPEHTIYVPATTSFSIDLGETGDYYATGMVVTNSSTGPTLTHGTTDCFFSALFK